MTDQEFRTFMDLMMVSDPWPLGIAEHNDMLGLANREAEKRGYENWIVAYHEMLRERKDG